MNVSKQHREDLLNKIQQIRTYIASAPQDTNTGNLLQYLDELTKDVKGKKYGLVFEQHREQIDEILDTHTPVLTEQKDLFIDNGGEMNFLIEGDNLAALKLLEKTHKGKIDVIYIDPPYNTGNEDFIYNDDFVDKEDSFRHSKWISFMYQRLVIAKKLLSNKGLIFISIDDNEQSSLKILCDEIFGEEKFISCVVNQSANSVFGTKAAHKDKTFIKTKDQILVYRCGEEYVLKPIYTPSKIFIYDSHEFILENGIRYSTTEWFKKKYSDLFKKFDIKLNKKSIQSLMEFNESFRHKVMNELVEKQFGTWPYTKEDLTNEEQDKISKGLIIEHNGLMIMRENGGKGLVRYLRSLKESCRYIDGEWRKCDILGDVWNNAAGYGNINAEGDVRFPNGKKPLILLEKVIRSSSELSSTILDFFAGSGTTGHAVMKLNAEDGGHRKFILCTNSENNICRDVTYERLKTVITGKRKDGSEYSEKYDASLKYYKIDFVKIDDKMYYEYADDLLKHVRELVELENGINFNGNAEIAIVLTDEEMEEFVSRGYGKDVACRVSTLYRGHDVLLTDKQETFLKENGIKVNVIPDYYYNELNR